MTRTIFVALFPILSAHADDLSGPDIMRKIAEVYSHLSAIHVVAERQDIVIANGQSNSLISACELAARNRQLFLARLKRNGVDSLCISDGETTWKALGDKKEWMQFSAGTSGSDEEESSGNSRDLRTFIAVTTYGQYSALAKLAENPVVQKIQDVKLSGLSVPCYVVHAQTPKADYDLWVDRERFVVLQSIMKSHPERGVSNEIRTRIAFLQINQTMPDELFHFNPPANWKEVEMLSLPGEERAILTGARAANFSLKTLEGEPVALNQTRGKVVVLDFWATWCGPCRKELPTIEKLRSEFADKAEFYGVNDESSSTVRDFLKKNNYAMTTLMDGNRAVHRQYNVTAIPTLLVIDPQGVIRAHFIGGRTEATLRQAIQTAAAH